MNDLIDRDITIHELEEFRDSCIANLLRMSFEDITDVVKDIPAVNRWIPCSERMPEKDTSVLICGAGHRVTAYYDAVYGVFRLTESDDLFYKKSAVTHWMAFMKFDDTAIDTKETEKE